MNSNTFQLELGTKLSKVKIYARTWNANILVHAVEGT